MEDYFGGIVIGLMKKEATIKFHHFGVRIIRRSIPWKNGFDNVNKGSFTGNVCELCYINISIYYTYDCIFREKFIARKRDKRNDFLHLEKSENVTPT